MKSSGALDSCQVAAAIFRVDSITTGVEPALIAILPLRPAGFRPRLCFVVRHNDLPWFALIAAVLDQALQLL
jgi:hypothetical protein